MVPRYDAVKMRSHKSIVAPWYFGTMVVESPASGQMREGVDGDRPPAERALGLVDGHRPESHHLARHPLGDERQVCRAHHRDHRIPAHRRAGRHQHDRPAARGDLHRARTDRRRRQRRIPPMLDGGPHKPVPHAVARRIDAERGLHQHTPRIRAEQLHVRSPHQTALALFVPRLQLRRRPKPHRHHPLDRFTDRQPIARPQQPPLHSPEPRREIRRPAPEHRRDVDATRQCDIQKPAAHEPAHHQLAPGPRAITPVHRHRLAIERRLDPPPPPRKNPSPIPPEPPPAQAPLESRGTRAVSHQHIADGKRPPIHRPTTGHAVRTMPGPPRVLHGQVRWRRDDLDHPPPGTNRTRSPAAKTAGGFRIGSNNPTDVRPMRCHPPGIAYGYTPVCAPAIATDPAGTRALGSVRRGTTRAGSSSPRYAHPGTKPRKYTVYVGALCRAITSATASPVRRATSSRSGPSYCTGMTCSRPAAYAGDATAAAATIGCSNASMAA